MADPQPGHDPAPGDVDEHLHWLLRALAVERDELYRRLGAARGEVERLRATLRRWQAQHGHCVRRGRPTNRGRWGDLR